MEILAEILRHLPPSQAALQLWMLGDASLAPQIVALRPDVECLNNPPTEASIDAVLMIMDELSPHAVAEALASLREGGRMIAWVKVGDLTALAGLLETAGYARILTEQLAAGVLVRGEKPYAEGLSTLERVAVGAMESTAGRYLHLLIKQTPNKPAWALRPDDVIQWEAVAIDNPLSLLAFTSLPKAVEFMQKAVLQGKIRDVTKIAKFSHATVAVWNIPVVINPALDQMEPHLPFILNNINPATAEASDE